MGVLRCVDDKTVSIRDDAVGTTVMRLKLYVGMMKAYYEVTQKAAAAAATSD